MKTVFESNVGLDTAIVPIVSLERMSPMTLDQRDAVLSELEEIEVAMTGGAYETYSPELLKQRFLKVYNPSN
jgi:hypothetical protein